jgi:hypothetical protein
LQETIGRRDKLTGARLRTPRAAAIAGIVFSVLLVAAFWLIKQSIPADPRESGAWLKADTGTVLFALNLIPISGIGFLWFMGVLRDRLGASEDRFFATVFLGSGLLLLGALFMTAALAGGIVITFAADPEQANSAAFHFARAATYNVMNIYAVKVAGVFMISTSTIVVYTRIVPRWIAFLGYALALFLFFGNQFVGWAFICFPLWIFLISVQVIIENLRTPAGQSGGGG